jgi:hypothetical protein
VKTLLIPLAACAALAGCAVDPGYGYGYPAPAYGPAYGYPAGSVYYGAPVYPEVSIGVFGTQHLHDGRRRGFRDSDRDGIPNRLDRDLDNDGIPNRMDRDRDGDGVPNRQDARPNNPRRR